MKTYADGNIHLVVLKKGEELFESLARFVKENNIKSAWFNGFGATMEVELGYYDLSNQKYEWKKFNGPLEITGLQGNLVQKDGQSAFHIHGSFSDDSYNVLGGHIKRLVVAGTLELLLTPLEVNLTRKLDDEVGLELLSD